MSYLQPSTYFCTFMNRYTARGRNTVAFFRLTFKKSAVEECDIFHSTKHSVKTLLCALGRWDLILVHDTAPAQYVWPVINSIQHLILVAQHFLLPTQHPHRQALKASQEFNQLSVRILYERGWCIQKGTKIMTDNISMFKCSASQNLL